MRRAKAASCSSRAPARSPGPPTISRSTRCCRAGSIPISPSARASRSTACTNGCWRARRRRDGARSPTSPASQYSSAHPHPTSSPAPQSLWMADIRSWASFNPGAEVVLSRYISRQSVPCDDRATEFVAQPGNGRLHVAGLRVKAVHSSGRSAELVARGLEGRVVVFDADNPVLGKSVFPARANRPAVVPFGTGPRADEWRNDVDNGQVAVYAGIAALEVEQIVVERDAGASRDGRHQIGPPTELIIPSKAKYGVEQAAVVVHPRDRAFKAE